MRPAYRPQAIRCPRDRGKSNGIPDIAQADRLGHTLPGISGVYSHTTPAMIEQIVDALQRRWTTALDQALNHTGP
ncbi:Integrase family protein [Carbonactinospora thermoautotrophica]|uniref:Integrase family protein n=1 Tax=Carbonactinospora thermoautotrophica TaxID=1469144 RepID=A0A132MSK6_9ACTN|nr:hypothetical protein [Carbonactinospora thermoautotrophica]KWX00833.1 Integrase family protein [Carbonactinospora thermoautotrophica]